MSVVKMIQLLLTLLLCAVSLAQNDPSSNQVIDFMENTKGPIGIMTTSSGMPIEMDSTNTLNINLVNNDFFLDNMMHVMRERIPERVVHAKGSGGFGYFEVTHDISHICKAKLFSKIGKKTPVAVRFSQGFSSKGAVDTGIEPRGFAVKFYTEEGNFDFTGLNFPMFAFKDPILFSPFTHAARRNPSTNLKDVNMFWDFSTQYPESFYVNMFLFSDRGIPRSYRYMSGHAVHTYQVYNKNGETSYCRFHLLPKAGIQTLNATEANRITATDPDRFTRDLYNAIGNGEFPVWEFSVQILTPEDVKNANVDVFDVTIELPFSQYPLHPVGKLVLNKNPVNYFAEIEQLAFGPGNLVPGILGAPDKVYESRRLAYRDAQNYRLGSNYNGIYVNCPLKGRTLTYNRDGVPPLGDNGKNTPNYYPNSFNGAVPYKDKNIPSLIKIYEKQPNNFKQAANFYSNILKENERTNLVENILKNICSCTKTIKERAVKIFKTIHPDLGKRIAKGIYAKCNN